MSEQVKEDKRIRGLIDGVVEVFKHIREFNGLDLQSKLDSLNEAVGSLFNLLIRICIFVREYLRPSFIGKTDIQFRFKYILISF